MRNNLLLTIGSLSYALEVSLIFICWLLPTQFRLYFSNFCSSDKSFIPSSWEIVGSKVSFPSRYTLSFITKRFGSVFPLSHLVIGLGFLSQLIRLWSCLIIGLLSMRSLSLLIPN
nr:MAG TPA: hypothetical protein [Caudoviricetes sp.]